MLSIKLVRLVYCFFWFNRNIDTRCFGIEFETTETNCSETNWYKPKQPETTQTFMKKYQYMLSIKFFRLVFCLFRFNRSTETLCFGIEAKQSKRTFVSDSAETCFGSSFGCFESKLVSKDTLRERQAGMHSCAVNLWHSEMDGQVLKETSGQLSYLEDTLSLQNAS